MKNPHVWDLFEQFTFQAINKGHKHCSAWLVVNRIRWETTIETTGNDFKISNDFIAHYARYFMALHPQHEGFFKTKQLKEEKFKLPKGIYYSGYEPLADPTE